MLAFLVLAATAAAALQDGPPPTLEVRVNRAIDRGVEWLKKEQQADGSWGHTGTDEFRRGTAALGFLTLIKSGVREGDPAIQKCLHYFSGPPEFDRTYSTGVELMAWEALKRGKVDLPRVQAGAQWLMEHRDRSSKLWAYPHGDVDLSNTQYAILGLHAAARMGVKIPPEFLLESILAVAKRHQERQGGSFTYRDPADFGTGSMTVAAITDLRIAAIALKGYGPYEARRAELESIEKSAFAWLERNYRIDANPTNNTGRGFMRPWQHYYLYGLERACSLAGKPKLGTHAWYPEGAEHLVSTQDEKGAWKGEFPTTCFALLFLKRATLTWSGEKEPSGEFVGAPVVAATRRPPAPQASVPFLKDWLVAGPFSTKRNEPFAKDEIGEAAVRSGKVGESAGTSNKKWVAGVLTDGWVLVLDGDKGAALAPYDGAFVYAFTTVRVAKEQDAVLWLGHDDGARAWLNGKLVYEGDSYGEAPNRDAYFAQIRLKAGVNTLLFKVVDWSYGSGLCARIATPAGGPIE